jgi:hypothetical protein
MFQWTKQELLSWYHTAASNLERLTISGSGNWDASPFLSDALWMAFL